MWDFGDRENLPQQLGHKKGGDMVDREDENPAIRDFFEKEFRKNRLDHEKEQNTIDS